MASIEIDIEQRRRALGLSQQELEDASGIARTTLRRKIPRPGTFTLDEAADVSRALGITGPEWLGVEL